MGGHPKTILSATPMDYLHHIEAETRTFLSAAASGDLDAPVSSCPGWTVRDLVGHLATVQRFHGTHLLRGVTDPPPGPRPTPPDTGVIQWGHDALGQLLANLAEVGTDGPAWTFLAMPEPHTTGFWYRRMAMEAAIHRWDLQNALGEPDAFDRELALDGIDEVLGTFVPGTRRGEEPEGTVDVTLTDDDRTWTVVSGDPDAARASISGPTDQVWLRLWGRIPLDGVDVTGDRTLGGSLTAGR